MADKPRVSDTLIRDQVSDKVSTGLSSSQTEGYKPIEKALAPFNDANLPGFSLDKGTQTVSHPDGSAVVFNQGTDGNAQVHSIKTFDGHLATPAYGEDGSLNSLTIKPRGEEPYTLSRASDDKFDWLDSRTGELSRRDIAVHAGSNPAKTAEIAMYHEGKGTTLFAPEAKVKPDVALKDLRSLFGPAHEYPFSSGSAVPFNNADGTTVSMFDPKYEGQHGMLANGEHSGLSAKAEIVAIKTDDGRGVILAFDSAQKGADGRPLVTAATVHEADGSQFELKRVGDTNQWRDSRTGTLKNLQVERAVGTNASRSAEILIKDLDDPAKNLFFNPHGKTPLLTDVSKITEKPGVDDMLANFYKKVGSQIPADLREAIEKSGATAFKDFSKLTDFHDASFYTKSEDLGYAFLRSHGSKIGLGVAAAVGLVAVGKWAFSRHNSDAPAPHQNFGGISSLMPDSMFGSMPDSRTDGIARLKIDGARNAILELSHSKTFEEQQTKLPGTFRSLEK